MQKHVEQRKTARRRSLDELKAVSSKSSCAEGFADDGGNVDAAPVASEIRADGVQSEPLKTAVEASLFQGDRDGPGESADRLDEKGVGGTGMSAPKSAKDNVIQS